MCQKENYLIICPAKGMATSLLYRVAEYLDAHHVTNLKVHKHHGVITITEPRVTIRFATGSEVHGRALDRGFCGTIVSGYKVDKFLDPWERERARKALKEQYPQVF